MDSKIWDNIVLVAMLSGAVVVSIIFGLCVYYALTIVFEIAQAGIGACILVREKMETALIIMTAIFALTGVSYILGLLMFKYGWRKW